MKNKKALVFAETAGLINKFEQFHCKPSHYTNQNFYSICAGRSSNNTLQFKRENHFAPFRAKYDLSDGALRLKAQNHFASFRVKYHSLKGALRFKLRNYFEPFRAKYKLSDPEMKFKNILAHTNYAKRKV